ncbi:hypothetical protein SK128_005057, partial [Halocaridina rubra]
MIDEPAPRNSKPSISRKRENYSFRTSARKATTLQASVLWIAEVGETSSLSLIMAQRVPSSGNATSKSDNDNKKH